MVVHCTEHSILLRGTWLHMNFVSPNVCLPGPSFLTNASVSFDVHSVYLLFKLTAANTFPIHDAHLPFVSWYRLVCFLLARFRHVHAIDLNHTKTYIRSPFYFRFIFFPIHSLLPHLLMTLSSIPLFLPPWVCPTRGYSIQSLLLTRVIFSVFYSTCR